MLSRKRMRALIRRTYGTSASYTNKIARLYRNANRQIKGEISAFIDSGASWSGKPSKTDIRDAEAELRALQYRSNDDLTPIIKVQLGGLVMGHPKNSDVVGARLSIPLIKVANQLHGQLGQLNRQVHRDVQKMTNQQAHETPQLHPSPPNYDALFQRAISHAYTDAQHPVQQDINRNIKSTIDQVKEICRQASQDQDAKIDWAKRVDRVLTGKDGQGGASARAQTIMRTESCYMLNSATIDDYKARGVQQYTFMSLEADNSCYDCMSMNGDTYDVDDAQAGVNLPPMHPNCQCWIVEMHDTDYNSPDDYDDDDFK